MINSPRPVTSGERNTMTDDAAIDVNLAYAESMKIFRCAFAKASLWLSPNQNAVDNEELKQQV